MTVYEALRQIKSKSFVLFGSDAFQHDMSALDSEIDRHIYNLIKDVCSLHAEISDKGIEFQPSIVLMGKRSFGLQDMVEADFKLLESLKLELLPVNIRARIADLLWTQRKIYTDALAAIDAYIDLFTLLFSEDDWIESINMIRRAVCISAQVNQKEKHAQACKLVYDKILEIDGTDKLFLSLHLFGIVVREKYGDADLLIGILNKVMQNSGSNVHKAETAFDLIRECFKWKKDDTGVYNTNIALAKYYEEKAAELNCDDFQTIVMAENYLKKAVFIYRNNNNPAQAERLQKQIVNIQSKSLKQWEVSEEAMMLVICMNIW